MSKTDYVFKSQVLRDYDFLIKELKQSRYKDYCISSLYDDGVVMPNLDKLVNVRSTNDILSECLENGLEKVYKECLKINDATWHRQKRLLDRVKAILLGGNCLFLTLTFNDSTLAKTDLKQRRVFVTRFLKSFGGRYVANIDFGKTNHREHYHALINADYIDSICNEWHYKYGFVGVESVRNKSIINDSARLSRYISKLSNHAIKETTKRCALIYSR